MPLVFYRTPTQKVQATPLVGDVFVREFIDSKVAANKTLPAFGTAHPDSSKWPNHKFAAAGEPDDEGIQAVWYVADFATQQAYNWQVSDTNEWPVITQNFVILRSAYDPSPADEAATYPPPSLVSIDVTGYQITGRRETRIGEPKLDSLYVMVEVIREKIDVAQSGVSVDADTGALRTFSKKKVAAGTAGQAMSATGEIKEVTPINSLWSELTTRQAVGLFGQMVAGVASRITEGHDNFYWPPVLQRVYVAAIPGPTAGEVAMMYWRPVWQQDEYAGPCKVTITEVASIAAPTVNAVVPMLPQSIDFSGALIRGLHIPKSLHGEVTIYEGTGGTETLGAYVINEVYPATSPTAWPATVVASITVTPMLGGYLTRTVVVDRPASYTQVNDIVLTAEALTNGVQLDWVLNNSAGTLQDYYVTIATDAQMAFGFVSGYNNLDVNQVLTLLVTSTALARNQAYYVRVKGTFSGATSPVYSNVVSFIMLAAPRIQVEQPASTILVDGTSTSDFGSVAMSGGTATKTYTIRNIGEHDLTDLVVSFSGSHSADYTVTTALGSTTVAAGSSTTFIVTFNPSALSTRTAVMSIANNDPSTGANPFTVNLTGYGTAPQEIQIEQPVSNILVDGVSTVDFGQVTTPATAALLFTITNLGTTALTGLLVTKSGADEADWQINTQPATSIGALGTSTFEVTYDPVGGLARASVATLHVASDDSDENPFDIAISGQKL